MCKGLSETEASASHAVFVGRGRAPILQRSWEGWISPTLECCLDNVEESHVSLISGNLLDHATLVSNSFLQKQIE